MCGAVPMFVGQVKLWLVFEQVKRHSWWEFQVTIIVNCSIDWHFNDTFQIQCVKFMAVYENQFKNCTQSWMSCWFLHIVYKLCSILDVMLVLTHFLQTALNPGCHAGSHTLFTNCVQSWMSYWFSHIVCKLSSFLDVMLVLTHDFIHNCFLFY